MDIRTLLTSGEADKTPSETVEGDAKRRKIGRIERIGNIETTRKTETERLDKQVNTGPLRPLETFGVFGNKEGNGGNTNNKATKEENSFVEEREKALLGLLFANKEKEKQEGFNTGLNLNLSGINPRSNRPLYVRENVKPEYRATYKPEFKADYKADYRMDNRVVDNSQFSGKQVKVIDPSKTEFAKIWNDLKTLEREKSLQATLLEREKKRVSEFGTNGERKSYYPVVVGNRNVNMNSKNASNMAAVENLSSGNVRPMEKGKQTIQNGSWPAGNIEKSSNTRPLRKPETASVPWSLDKRVDFLPRNNSAPVSSSTPPKPSSRHNPPSPSNSDNLSTSSDAMLGLLAMAAETML